MSQKRKNRAKARRAVYILPNLFTTFSLFAGFFSIVSSINGRFAPAAWAIFLAAVFDTLDGTVARMTRTTSRFGVEYDSLCDLVSFGVAPAVLLYQWSLRHVSRGILSAVPSDDKTMTLGFVAAFVFLACGALRLARFNVSAGSRDPGFFEGLPIPGGAAIAAAAVLWHHRIPSAPPAVPDPALILALTVVTAFLMVSNLDYFSLKNKVVVHNRRPFETLVLIILVLALLIFKGRTLLLPLGLVYLASGPVVTLIRSKRRRACGPVECADGAADEPAGPAAAGAGGRSPDAAGPVPGPSPVPLTKPTDSSAASDASPDTSPDPSGPSGGKA
ncbi:MAG: CDP-diacylglycerol--serine O-phosphatidyltransferase [Deltaproteobacteria bacterium]|jgi:CDP-diacylglycerol--serine O-phosphatidyltransferase|nr:CDP-diacylglycerol--serine O-phosphatidyltransferase [Deltaproteobacteria bacterium]